MPRGGCSIEPYSAGYLYCSTHKLKVRAGFRIYLMLWQSERRGAENNNSSGGNQNIAAPAKSGADGASTLLRWAHSLRGAVRDSHRPWLRAIPASSGRSSPASNNALPVSIKACNQWQ